MRDEAVVAIGPNNDAEERLAAAGVRLVVGDPRLSRVLSQAEVETAGVIVLTGDQDLANLNTALAASQLQPAIRVVIRMFDQELGSHIPELFPDAVALSSSALAAPGFVSAAIDGESGTSFRIAGRLVTSRQSADPALSGQSIPIARLNADRTVDVLPDADPGEPNLIVIDVANPEGRRSGHPCAGPRQARHASAARRARLVPRSLPRARTAAPAVRGDPGTARRRIGALLPGRRRPVAARCRVVRHHAAHRRLAAGQHRGRGGQHGASASTRSS